MPDSPRYALYYMPNADEALGQAGAFWLGWDAYTAKAIAQPDDLALSPDDIKAITTHPRRYGFHGTLKAPFRLAVDKSEADLVSAVKAFCTEHGPVDLPGFSISKLDRFYALTVSQPATALNERANEIVKTFDLFRAPLTEAEIEKRKPAQLSETQRDNLMTWGYPHVFDDFRFHLTLTDAVDDEDGTIADTLHNWFDAPLSQPVSLDQLTIAIEPKPGAPFTVFYQEPFAKQDP